MQLGGIMLIVHTVWYYGIVEFNVQLDTVSEMGEGEQWCVSLIQ